MVRKRTSHRHKRKNIVSARGGPAFGWNFRVRAKAFFFAVIFLVIAVFLLNPKPADITFDNAYRKVSHMLLHEESEYVTKEYITDAASQSGEYDTNASKIASIFENSPVEEIAGFPGSYAVANVLPANIEQHILSSQNDQKWIEVDLSEQKIRAWENGEQKMEFLVSSGKPWTPTLSGDFRIWIKLRYANMKGGSKERGDYYFLPNVPCVMYYDRGYGIHGAYWHMNFGNPMSHGCVNVKPDEACELFEWVTPVLDGKSSIKSTPENPGTRVVVHD